MKYIKHRGNDTCLRGTLEIRVSLLAPYMYMQRWRKGGKIVSRCLSSSEIPQF